MYACDATWWNQYFPEIGKGFKGDEMWTVAAASRDQYKLHWIYGIDQAGLSKNPNHIHTGHNSGYQAISLAHHFGCARILLIGFDFQRTKGRTHWHGDHPRGLGNGGNYQRWCQSMNALAKDATAIGLEIINCSRQTALTCFPRSTIQEALADAHPNRIDKFQADESDAGRLIPA